MRLRIPTLVAIAAAAQVTVAAAATPSACDVLSKRDVAAVQGEAFSDVKLSSLDGISQCFYRLPTFAKSVSVDVIRDDAQTFWEEHFSTRKGAQPRKKRRAGAKHVGGIGDDAYWTGSPVAGSLYVLKGDAILRISVGGPGSEGEKLARSKRLAARALKRL